MPLANRAREITEAITASAFDGNLSMREALQPLNDAFEGEAFYAYVLDPPNDVVDWTASPRFDPQPNAFKRLARAPNAWGIDIFHPPSKEQNRVVSLAEIARGREHTPLHASYLRRLLGMRDTRRALLCTRGRLLANVGLFYEGAASARDTALLELLLAPMQKFFSTRELLRTVRQQASDIRVLLESLPEPAWLTSKSGVIRDANAQGRLRLSRTGAAALRRSIADAVLRGDPRYRVTRVDDGVLVLENRSSGRSAVTVETQAAAWQLTPKQTEVWRLLARGCANKEIAIALRCAVRTVEVHVTAIFRRAGVESRSELLASIVDSSETRRRTST